jgi:hypothetical protein
MSAAAGCDGCIDGLNSSSGFRGFGVWRPLCKDRFAYCEYIQAAAAML